MGELIDDEVLDAFAVVGEPEQVASKVLERFGDVIDRVSFYMPYAGDQRRSSAILTGFKAGSS
jgi:hypothetical protein